MARSRLAVIATGISIFLIFSYLLLPSSPSSSTPLTTSPPPRSAAATAAAAASPASPDTSPLHVSSTLLSGNAIMPHLGNETIKAELGRASWKLLHTTLARFPKEPTADEREALSSYLHLFARLYPCGECAAHFTKLLKEFPPQTGGRESASQWGCYVHNLVNERLRKERFDCKKVLEEYKCGCADSEDDDKNGSKDGSKAKEARKKEEVVLDETELEGKDALERNVALSKKQGARVEIQRDGLMNGG